MRPRRGPRHRRGSTLAEAALVLLAFLTLVLGMIDLGLAVSHEHVLSQAARQAVRRAIVHGSLAPGGWNGGPWGPGTFGPATVGASPSDPKLVAVAPYLAGLDPTRVQVTYEWLDGKNDAEKRVRATVSATWTPMIGFLFGRATRTLTAASTMPIAH